MDTDVDLEVSPRAIRNTRLRRGLSPTEAAEKAGLAPKTWYVIESGGARTCRMGTLRSIAKALEVEVTDLLVPVRGREGVA